MRGAIISCTLITMLSWVSLSAGQERYQSKNPRQPTYMLIAEKSTTSSSWSSWNLWPTGLGSRLTSGARGAWNSLSMGTSRAWYATQYTIAPWSKPAPRSLTGSRGMTSSSKSKSKASQDETASSWWPSFDWFGGEKEEKLKNVGDWQEMSSPAEGFE